WPVAADAIVIGYGSFRRGASRRRRYPRRSGEIKAVTPCRPDGDQAPDLAGSITHKRRSWRAGEDASMIGQADAATLNVQPRQRRRVYMWLAAEPEGRSVKRLLEELDIPEPELRETLRKLNAAGLAKRTKAAWVAIPLEGADSEADLAHS
ncbi:MAG TPA: helix-turn-helix domain-containing protein, partial [Solirubrobacteraceae bacterium]|nr:helix-turn-helix domain-containing protein [Solirubrobacteraceae bacterium]